MPSILEEAALTRGDRPGSTDYGAGKLLMVGLEGPDLTRPERDFLERCRPAGVILFGRNIDSGDRGRLKALTAEIRALCQTPGDPVGPLIAIDQEGGRVARIKGSFPNRGPALLLEGGATSFEALSKIRAYGQEVAEALVDLGINVNFAPVVDLLTEPRNTAIGDRCFGTTAEQVILRAGAFLEGLSEGGVLGCLKHFPGQGHAQIDTHLGTAVIDVDRETLLTRELAPFRALHPKAPMIMVAHGVYPVLDSKPASLSAKMMTDLLRGDLGFAGMVVSDDMLMGAIPQEEDVWTDLLVQSVRAGADLLLVCKGLDRIQLAWTALAEKASRDPAFADLLHVRAKDRQRRKF